MTDRELQRHVEDGLGWEPSVDAADVGVTVENGVVTLRGEVASYSERAAAERATQHVYGVKAVANDITVRLPGPHQRTDPEIATAAATRSE
jgi:osmotically-inducible protein OsmY